MSEISKKVMSEISGFPEWLPAQEQILARWKAILAAHFESFCFTPMDTPVVERMTTLLSKGDDSEIYTLNRWADKDNATTDTKNLDRQLGLRFDLTVPLARYVTQHSGQLIFPYRRYHIAPVWRGERPQEGRFRQFYQCDIDTIGQDILPPEYDAEIIHALHTGLAALNIGSFLGPVTWHLNHRAILTTWAQHAGIEDVHGALRLIDKNEKIGLPSVLSGLRDLNASESALEILGNWAQQSGNAKENIATLHHLDWPSAFHDGLRHLTQTINMLVGLGLPQDAILFTPLLARGLSYYSGITFEAKLPTHPNLGSICAGGRYDHLASTLASKKMFPGVGGSLGLSRLFAFFIQKNPAALEAGDILVCVQEPQEIEWYVSQAALLRAKGWRVEVFLGQSSLKNQLKYANRKGFRLVLLANAQEIASGHVQVKIMSTGHQEEIELATLPHFAQQYLSSQTLCE